VRLQEDRTRRALKPAGGVQPATLARSDQARPIDHCRDYHCCHSDCGPFPREAWSRRHVRSDGWALANRFFGALFGIAARAVKRSASWRYFFWLLMTFNLFSVGGYFLLSGIGNFGDWTPVAAGWQPAWAWPRGPGCAGDRYLSFLFLCLCPCANCVRSEGGMRGSVCGALASSWSRLIHCRGPRVSCGRDESGGTAADSDFRCRCVPCTAGASPAANSRCPKSTQPGMDHRRRGPGDRVHRVGPGVKFHSL
jgi:hypothetical protein